MFARRSVLALAAAGAGLAALSAVPARADQLADILARKELKCGTFADVPPFAAPDPKTREMAGFDVDLCRDVAKHLGVSATIVPLSVEARVPEVQMGRVDVTIANLAYTTSRASADRNSATPTTSLRRCSPVKGQQPGDHARGAQGQAHQRRQGLDLGAVRSRSTAPNPVTFQDTGSAYMALQQNKSVGMVANTMTITKLVNQSQDLRHAS